VPHTAPKRKKSRESEVILASGSLSPAAAGLNGMPRIELGGKVQSRAVRCGMCNARYSL